MRYVSILGLALALAFWSSATAFLASAQNLSASQPPTKNVASKCLNDLQTFDAELTRLGFGVLPPGGFGPVSAYYDYPGTPWQRMRSLGKAARVYALDGDEQSCQLLLSSMRKIYQDHKKLVGTEADDLNAKLAWRRAHLANAKPVTEMKRLMRADLVVGADIRNAKDENLGDIQDIVIDPKRQTIAYVLVSRGGFFGIGEKWTAVRWSDLRATDDHRTYVLDVPPNAIEGAPVVDRSNFEKTTDPEWQRALAQYWDGVIKK